MNKNGADEATTVSEHSSRSPERKRLAELITARDAAAEALAGALKRRAEVEERLSAERRALSPPADDDDDDDDPADEGRWERAAARDLRSRMPRGTDGNLEVLVRDAAAAKQKVDAAAAAIGVLEQALRVRDLAVSTHEDVLARAERDVERCAREVLSTAMTKLFDGLPELEKEVARRRLHLRVLLRNDAALNGFGRLSEEALAVRAHLRKNDFPADDYLPPWCLDDETPAAYQIWLERLAVDPDAVL